MVSEENTAFTRLNTSMKIFVLGLAALLLGSTVLAQAQTFPSPTYQNLTVNGSLTLGSSAASANLILNGPAGSNRYLLWQTNGSYRWDLRTDATAESTDGSKPNSGSKFMIDARDDTGKILFTPLQIDRQYGAWTITTGTINLSGNDPGTQGSTKALQINEFYSGTTTGTPLTYNQIWVRDNVNDNSQGQTFVVQNDAGCTFPNSCPPTSSFTASISGNVLTVTAVDTPPTGTTYAIKAGDFVKGTGVLPTHINTFASGGTTGTGGVGTYQLDNALSGTVASEKMTTITPISSRGRQGIVGTVNVTGPVSPPNGAGTYNAGRTGLSVSGDGGQTMTTRGANAQVYNWIMMASPGATGWDAAGIGQNNLYVYKGNNLAVRSHNFYSTAADDGTQGGQADFFLQFGATPQTNNKQPAPYYGLAMQNILMLGSNGAGVFPLDENNGEIIMATPYLGALISPRPPMKTWRGLDLANISFSDCVLCLPGNRTLGNGDMEVRRLGITDGTNGPVVDGTYSVASIASIGSSPLGGYYVGEQYPTRLGGFVIVDSVAANGAVTAMHYGVPPYRKAGEVVQVAWAFVQDAAAAGQPILYLRNTSLNMAPGDTVVALGPAAACNNAVPAGTTIATYTKGAGDAGIRQSITLSANLTAAVTYGCMLSFRRTMLSTTDTIVQGWTATPVVLNVTWTAPKTLQLGATVDTVIGPGTAMATSATGGGFLHLPFTNGTPTGTPATTTQGPACVWNDTTFTLNCYSPSSGAWKHITLTAGAG
jgi:hypothetical protein